MFTQRPSFRYIATGAVVSLFALTFLILGTGTPRELSSKYILKAPSRPCPASSFSGNQTWDFVVERDGNNHGLSEDQCRIAFPKLYNELDKSSALRADRHFTYKEFDSRTVDDHMVRGIIDRGELYIVDYAPMPVTATRARATLNSLHRALTAFPDRHLLPSIEFTFTSEDFAADSNGIGPVWAYSKRDSDESVWLMPDFGYWAWPEVQIGPYHEVRRRIAAIDDGEFKGDGSFVPGLKFQDKKKQLVWRGSLATNPPVRAKLLKSALDHSWASVRVIDWDDENDIRFNLLPIEDHCRYMFLAHAEGRSFSGRGKYLLNCRSVVISHTLEWREAHHGALISSGPDANYVEVDRDFADLPRKMEYLIDNPEAAERIANNAVHTFRDRYLTPAAESCYWRQLVRQYAAVCDFEPVLFSTTREGKMQPRGMPYDTWLLTH
ncbi:hypothetical protein PENANT_c003G10171 [Penicillium antarcticum]|uniref:Glycosyl transferase CAP10 domain-containing protein n=1 Tax=Penicillium antarcticum TaxID=416450 RepID=A0A1V6QHM0_9EURO|nr:uncharacterized protein N7508_005941 [Penicillium antarcticum]KAJ5306926.1 hypothetical protein N7508_005941 [Penicillium antarcticum]OQD88695.1 hypothetical protein PENANT_c003G10171 [Penicillium antarcticum]